MEEVLAGLGSRVFLMNNVHEDEPVVFHTRWALSYLRGPLTREQIRSLMEPRRRAVAEAAARPALGAPARAVETRRVAPAEAAAEPSRPVVPPEIGERFLAVSSGRGDDERLVYRPALLGVASLHYANARANVDEWRSVALLAALEEADAHSPWDDSAELGEAPELEEEPEAGARFATLPSRAARPASYTRWGKMLKTHLYRTRPLRLWRCPKLKALSQPGESEGDFRVRLRQLLHERRDLELEKLRKRYAPKLARLQDRIRSAEARLEREEDQYRQQKMQTVISVGATVLGALLGRKLASARSVGRATTAMRGAGRAASEREDIGRAREDLEVLQQKLGGLEVEFEKALEGVREGSEAEDLVCEEMKVLPRKSDLSVEPVVLAWTPWQVDRQGIAEPVYET
jgi:hypothetical protein